MNGALIHDLLRDGGISNPIQYSEYYYSRLPVLSLPYHPPFFPAIEAVFYAIFGVNFFAARLAVALCLAVAVALFFALVLRTHRSLLFATISTISVFSLLGQVDGFRGLSTDTMLEVPALAFMIAALYCLTDLKENWGVKTALAFAFLAALAVWIKQTAVFLVVVLYLYVLVSRRWKLFIQKNFWVAVLAMAATVAPLVALEGLVVKGGFDHIPPPNETTPIFVRNLHSYLELMTTDLGTVTVVGIAVSALFFLLYPVRGRGTKVNDLYLAWSAGMFLPLLLIGHINARYLFFVYPGLAVVGVSALFYFGERLLGRRAAWCAPAGLSLILFSTLLATPVPFLRGPLEASRFVVNESPQRVLVCGRHNIHGGFVYGVRTHDPQLKTVVFRGDQLPDSTFSQESFEKFAHEYGISHIVLEETKSEAWAQLLVSPTQSMRLLHSIPLASSQRNYRGALRVYRFENPSSSPKTKLKVKSGLRLREVEMSLE